MLLFMSLHAYPILITSMVPPSGRLFGRQRPLHAALGGGKVGDVLLWRERRISGAILIGVAAIWFLLGVVEYNLVTLLCNLTITTMLLIFIWSSAAQFFNWNPPDIPQIVIEEDSNWREIGSIFHTKLNDLLFTLMYVGSGYDHKLFLLTIVSLWMISIIGSSITTLNLLLFGVVWLETIPLVYDKYEDEVDNLAYQVYNSVKKMYNFFDAEILRKIPRKN